MTRQLGHGTIALAALLAAGTASAQWRCDCTRILASCSASATAQPSFVEVTTDNAQCARVDYLIDGIPFVALVVDGTARQDWIAQSESPDIIVQSCQVCLDNAGTSAAAAVPGATGAGTTLASSGEPTRLIAVEPRYPAAAVAAGIEGYVDVRFTLSPAGTVIGPEVVTAEPAGIFDTAALAAVSRWRYTVPASGEAPELTERVSFDLGNGILALGQPARPAPAVATSTRTADNDCVREQSRFDFGSRIDVSLINACARPLLVYTCSAGTGSYHDRWVCRHPEQRAVISGAGAIAANRDGALAAAEPLGPDGRLEISRAPNGEYWWLACAVDDASCRNEGREWVRSTDGQTMNIAPQDRSRLRLARSY